MMAAVLRPFGLSYELAVPLMIIIDPIANMIRTMVNVAVNSAIPAILGRACGTRPRLPRPSCRLDDGARSNDFSACARRKDRPLQRAGAGPRRSFRLREGSGANLSRSPAPGMAPAAGRIDGEGVGPFPASPDC
jgi:hypothetical protein